MIERGASLPLSDRAERGTGRVFRTAARGVDAQGSWGTLGVWREPGRAGPSRSGPEMTLCARKRSSHGPWSEGPCRPSQSRGPSRGEEQVGARECMSEDLARPGPKERV